MELRATKIVSATTSELTIEIPSDYRDAWVAIAKKPTVQKSKQLYVKIDAPKKPWTTGKRSQNKHCWGHAQQIGDHEGYYKEEVMALALERATTKGYPTKDSMDGKPMPQNLADATTHDASLVIDELHDIAAFIPMKLREYDA